MLWVSISNFDTTRLLASKKPDSTSFSLGRTVRASTGIMLGVPILLLRAAAEMLRRTSSPPLTTRSDHDSGPPVHDDSGDAKAALQRSNGKTKQDPDQKSPICLQGFAESTVVSTRCQDGIPDASRAPTSIMQLNLDEDGTQSTATRTSAGLTNSQIHSPYSTIRQMSSMSFMLLAGSDRPRAILSKLFGSNKSSILAGDKGDTDEASSEKPSRSRSIGKEDASKKIVSQTDSVYGGQLREMKLCTCIFCLKERELKWQLFLLREQQEATVSSQHFPVRESYGQPQFLSPGGESHCSYFPRISQRFDSNPCHHQSYTSAAPVSPGLPYVQAGPRLQSHSRQEPPNSSVHQFTAFITFHFIIFLQYLYPRAKAFAQGVTAIDQRYRLRERAANYTCAVIDWTWRVLIVGALGGMIADLGERCTHSQCTVENGAPGKAGCGVDGALIVKRWIKTSVAEIIAGVCEGVEGGVKVWCGGAKE